MIVTVPDLHAGSENARQQQEFNRLSSEWKRETILLSKVNEIVHHLAYQKIIGMGPVAVPFILKDMVENGPNHWFWALRVITDENPATKEMAGNMVEMTEAWLQWGKKKGYLKDCPKNTSEHSQTLALLKFYSHDVR